jgi:hypothetical protein
MPNQLPPNLLPLLEEVCSRVPARDVPLDFWRIESGPKILDAFLDLAALLVQSTLEEGSVPRGYVLLAYLFQWEADCQSDGWGAFGNVNAAEFKRICDFYREVGLEKESNSLAHQMAAYSDNPSDQVALFEAADAHRHDLSGDLDRLEYLTQYFCDNAEELLYARV